MTEGLKPATCVDDVRDDVWDWLEANDFRPEPVADELRLEWRDGPPPKPWSKEWFIAETIYGDRVVLTALPEAWSYDFKTADETYMKAANVKRWMQFPDSEYIAPAPPATDQAQPIDEDALVDWQPIETAPKDVLCLLFEPHDEGGFCFVGCTDMDGLWVNNLDMQVQRPTHWMPLPAAPALSEHAGEGGD